jgi:hypothetical protein
LVCLLLHFDVLNPALQLIEPFLIVHRRPPLQASKATTVKQIRRRQG